MTMTGLHQPHLLGQFTKEAELCFHAGNWVGETGVAKRLAQRSRYPSPAFPVRLADVFDLSSQQCSIITAGGFLNNQW